MLFSYKIFSFILLCIYGSYFYFFFIRKRKKDLACSLINVTQEGNTRYGLYCVLELGIKLWIIWAIPIYRVYRLSVNYTKYKKVTNKIVKEVGIEYPKNIVR